MLHFITGRAGSGKTEYIYNLIDKNIENGYLNNILIVPEQFSFETERTIIRRNPSNSQAGLCEVTSFTRLCDRIFKEYGGITGTRVDNASRALILAMCIDEVRDNLNAYKRVSNHAEFVNLMLSSITEFKGCGVSSDDILQTLTNIDSKVLKQKLKEIALIYAAFESEINNAYSDPLDDLATATELALQHNFFFGKRVFIDAFNTFSTAQLKMLEVVIAQAEEVYVSLCLDGFENKPDYDLFFDTKDTFRKLKSIADKHAVEVSSPVKLTQNLRAKNETLKNMEKILSGRSEEITSDADHLIIYKADNRYDEAEFVASNICRLNREKGIRYRKIAVISRNISEYSGIIDSAFKRYDIPYFIDARRPLNHQPLMLMVSSLLKIFDEAPSTENIISLIKTGLTNISLSEIADFENYCYLWSVNATDIFSKPFTLNPKGPDRTFDSEALKSVENTRQIIVKLLTSFKTEVSKGGKSADYAKAIYNFVVGCGADKHLKTLANEIEDQGDIDSAEDLRRSYEILIDSLDTLVFTTAKKELSFKNFVSLYNTLIFSCDMGSLPQGIDEVPIASATRYRPSNPEVVFILGANQDKFPAVPSVSGILTDHDRIVLNRNNINISNPIEHGASMENFIFYNSACCASDEVYITYNKVVSDDDNGVASSPVENLMSLLPNYKNGSVFYDDKSGFALPDAFETTAFAQRYLAENYNRHTPLIDAIKLYFSNNPSVGFNSMKFAENGIEVDINPDTALLLFGKDLSISPTAMENFHKCGFLYFCQHGLRARSLKPFSVSSQLRGNLIHYVLEKAVSAYGGQNLKNISDDELTSFSHKVIKQYMNENIRDSETLTAIQKYESELVETTAVAATKHVADEYANTEFENLACELRVNSHSDEFTPIIIPLKSGGTVTMTGVIDRVDYLKKDGKSYLRIVDYKTGEKNFYLADLYYGVGLQPFFYLKSIIDGKILKEENVIPAGVFYMHAARKYLNEKDLLSTNEDRKTLLNKTAKLTGMILNDPIVISAMTDNGNSPFFPLKMNNGIADEKENAANLQFFNNVGDLTLDILRDMGNKLQNGKLDHIPFDPSGSSACKYCDFQNTMCPYKNVEHQKPKKLSKSDSTAIKEGGDFYEFFSD